MSHQFKNGLNIAFEPFCFYYDKCGWFSLIIVLIIGNYRNKKSREITLLLIVLPPIPILSRRQPPNEYFANQAQRKCYGKYYNLCYNGYTSVTCFLLIILQIQAFIAFFKNVVAVAQLFDFLVTEIERQNLSYAVSVDVCRQTEINISHTVFAVEP